MEPVPLVLFPLTPASGSRQQQQQRDGAPWPMDLRLSCESVTVASAQFESKRPEECSDNDQDAHHSRKLIQEVADEEEYDAHVAAPDIFLSHSGQQKAFVQHLDKALRYTNHSPFFDQITLPKGSPFPRNIKRAASGCKLGVVVLSDDFVTTKWPMLELEILLSKPDRHVLPLFYKLSPGDLKSPEKLSEWRREWQKLAAAGGNRGVKIESWEKLLRDLDSFNGVVFHPETSEVEYIDTVVCQICNLVPSPALYDLSRVRGHERLAKEVASLLDQQSLCMVGLHGIGGLGKTTMCRIMVNFCNSKYCGRSYLIEFPSDGNQKYILEECKRFLKQLLNLSEEHLLNKIHDFNQVVQLMRDHLRKHDLFIAMDNIWESSQEEAKRILQEFKNSGRSHSKILLTSRSKEVLQDLLGCDACVQPLPKLESAEAVQIFEDWVEQDGVHIPIRSSVLGHCMFDGTFHPLALKAAGRYVKGVRELEGDQNIELVMGKRIHKLQDVIKINYDHLSDVKKHIFLDIAYMFQEFEWELNYKKSRKMLSVLYEEYAKSEFDISNLIKELALEGVIDIVKPDIGAERERMIVVHDLYADLAKQEVATSVRFFAGGLSSFQMEEIQWKRLERVVLVPTGNNLDQMFLDQLQLQECPNLKVLHSRGAENVFSQGIHLDRMPSLCILQLIAADSYVKVKSIEKWGAAAASLAVINLRRVEVEGKFEGIRSLPCLEEVSITECELGEGPFINLHGCTQLESLEIKTCDGLEELPGLGTLRSLQRLCLWSLSSGLKSLHGLSGLVQLESLEIVDCNGLEELTGLGALISLQTLRLWNVLSSGLKSLHGLSGLVQLESLEIEYCEYGLEVLTGLGALRSLQTLCLWGLSSGVKSLHGLSGLVHLESLEIKYCNGLEELTDLGALRSLRWLFLRNLSSGLKSLHGLSGLVQLECLEIEDCDGLEELTGLGALRSLRWLVLGNLSSGLKSLHGLSGLVQLECLEIEDCDGLEELPGLSAFRSLQRLRLCKLSSGLKSLHGLSGLVQLECLMIRNCDGLEELTGLGALRSLRLLVLGNLSSGLKSLHGLSGLVQLECLEIKDCDGLEELTGLGALRSLRTLYLANLSSGLKSLHGLSGLVQLESLVIGDCDGLEELTGLGALRSLRWLALQNLSSLKRLHHGGLVELTMHCNGLVELWKQSKEEVLKMWEPQISDGPCLESEEIEDMSGGQYCSWKKLKT